MNQSSTTSGATHTTLDDNSIISLIRNGSDLHCSRSLASTASSQTSDRSSVSGSNRYTRTNACNGIDEPAQIFNYKLGEFVTYGHGTGATCEDVCIDICRSLNILPNTRHLFGLRLYDTAGHWLAHGETLKTGQRYSLRMRFKVQDMDKVLMSLDSNAYEYLYRQMRIDMERDNIPEISYPLKRDNVMGLGVVNMYIDMMEQHHTVERIEGNYKRYVPSKLVKEHRLVIKSRITSSFRQIRRRSIALERLKWNFVHEVQTLAPNYLMERYTVRVDYIPENDERPATVNGAPVTGSGAANATQRPRVYMKLFLHDVEEPDLKIAAIVKDETNAQWVRIAKLDEITCLCAESETVLRLEALQLCKGYPLRFERPEDLKSFVTYLGGYIRLTSKWMLDICTNYSTPSLQQLRKLRFHGPIGGNYSFEKIREKGNKLGSYIIRQCEKEYDTFYIDIKSQALHTDICKTETFKIGRHVHESDEWVLYINDSSKSFASIKDLVSYIPADTETRTLIGPSDNDKSPLLLICLPVRILSKISKLELGEVELQRMRPQIFNPKTDIVWHQNSQRECDNGKMIKVSADWTHGGKFKDINITLKMLRDDNDLLYFLKLTNLWHEIHSPHLLKLYGITISSPYTMIMEHSEYGPLNEFLQTNKGFLNMSSLKSVTLGLVRGLVYLRDKNIAHGYIRCSNLYVTSFKPSKGVVQAKIGDPGLARPYTMADLPWIPFEHYSHMENAKHDIYADMFAFATTVWEIFSYGQPIGNTTKEQLRQRYNDTGAILPLPDNCPDEICQTIYSGWSMDDRESRFNHIEMFERLRDNDDSSPDSDCSESSTNETDLMPHVHTPGQPEHFGTALLDRHTIYDDIPSVIKVPSGKIKCLKYIGKGHYGLVYLGEMQYNDPTKNVEQVAIKRLKTGQFTSDFKREFEIMQGLNHPNIVKIKLWVPYPFPVSIVMEYLQYGSFERYLNSHKPSLTNSKLLDFALDIAKGMDYLRSENVIHRDLAARNILVDRDRVKISDFGLAQIADTNGYYVARSNREIPIKWYSPESIETMKFSFQSDVWSYGVTLFEMFSRGEIPRLDPKRDLSQEEFLKRLQNGDRLRKHELCPDIVYTKLMLPCWHEKPKMRPAFASLIKIIESIKTDMTADYV